MDKTKEFVISVAYGWYVEDWCNARGYNPCDIDEEVGVNGECYVCLEEFEDNEFDDTEYMTYLFRERGFDFSAIMEELKW